MRKALAIVAAVIIVLLAAVMLVLMLNVTGLPLCEDRGALRTADECVEASSGERVVGLIAGWASVLAGFTAFALAVRLVSRGTGAGRFATLAALTPVLGLLSIAFLPVSF